MYPGVTASLASNAHPGAPGDARVEELREVSHWGGRVGGRRERVCTREERGMCEEERGERAVCGGEEGGESERQAACVHTCVCK